MRKWIQKSTRTSRRGMACAMAVALALSSLSAAPPAGAAEKKKPTLNVKKKTLYWNKPGSRNYTLKIKKNKVKMIVATTWKTSKKSVVALSKKKDTSVRLTAKRKGTATITATVKYVPIGKWAIKTAKLTCKVTSKETSPAKTPPAKTEPAQTPLIIYTTMPTLPPQPWITEKPADTPELEETADPDKSQEPTSTPNTPGDSTVTEVVLSTSEVLLGMEKGRNTITLTASAKDEDGNPLENQTVTWTSDNENVAAVDGGIVTAVGSGTAHITATVDNVSSKPCTVTVDAVKPVIKEADLSDGRTFYVAFSEPVTGTPSVSVKASDNSTIECESLTLSEEGTGMAIACRDILGAGSYVLTVNGLEDLAGNKMAEDSRISVEKESSVPTAFLCKTEQAPAGQPSFDVYFSIIDQYGEEYETLGVMSEGELTASAQTENGMPFKTQVNQQDGYIRVSGSASAFTEGRKIKITLTYSASGNTVIKETMTVTLVDAENKGKAVKIAGLNAESKTMDNGGSADKPVFQLSGTVEDNVFTLSSKLLDVFGYEADPSDVIYMIEDESILAFSGTGGAASDGIHTSSQPVTVQALKGGTTTITAYLASDDSQFCTITVTIKSTSLQEITVADPGEGTNGKMTEAKITLTPAGTGLTEDDLEYRVTEGAERLKELVFVQESDGIYINITAATDGSDAPIRFVVCSDGIESEEITYTSTPSLTAAKIEIDDFKENGVTAGATATTTYRILNRYNEDITKRTAKQPVCGISVPDVIKSATTGIGEDAGTLTVEALNVGTSEITLSIPGDSSVNAKVNVMVVGKAYVKEIRFGKATMEGLKLGETGTLYIPVQAYDQYGNGYEAFTMQTVDDEVLDITVNGTDISSNGFLMADYYETTMSQVALTSGATTKIGAIGIKWKIDNGTTYPKAGEILKISFTSKRDDLEMTPYELPINAEAEISRLELGNDVQAAIPGAKVENTVKLFDQYGAEVTAIPKDHSLQVQVVDKDGAPLELDSSEPTIDTGSITTISLTIPDSLTERKEYTVQVRLKEDNSNTTFKEAKVSGTYTLLADTADNLLEEIEISDKATKGVGLSLFLLDSQYINLTGPGTKLVFDCKMYTRCQGKDVEVAWKNDDGDSQIDANKLIWTVKAPETVTAKAEIMAKNTYTFSAAKGVTDPIEDVVTVSLTYVLGSKNLSAKDRSIKVSNKPAKPQGEYRLVTYDDSSYGTDNYLDKSLTAEVVSSKDAKFALITDDQYGEIYADTPLFTVISSKGVFSVEESFPTTTGTFTLTGTKEGDSDTIKVYVTKDVYYEFTAMTIQS